MPVVLTAPVTSRVILRVSGPEKAIVSDNCEVVLALVKRIDIPS